MNASESTPGGLNAASSRKPRQSAPRISCGGCDNTWTGGSRAHCAAAGCHRLFSSPAAFDRHRVNFQCVDPATIRHKVTGEPVLRFEDGLWRFDKDFDRDAIFGEGAA